MTATNTAVATLIILKTQFTNRFEGRKPASLTYSAEYAGNDEAYVKSYAENLIDEVCTQCDFWECVHGYNERFSIQVSVLGKVENKEELEAHVNALITAEVVRVAGRSPESSFWDDLKEG